LLPAIVLLVGRVQERFGLAIDLRHQGLNDRFTPAVEIAAYRIVQESLTNVARHASTDAALVQILVDDKTMTVFIQDHGGGFDSGALTRSGGLSGMRERVELLNGVFAVESAPGSGTTITAEFPLPGPGKARRRS
jgi:two-component system sensor histidine kinase DegS